MIRASVKDAFSLALKRFVYGSLNYIESFIEYN